MSLSRRIGFQFNDLRRHMIIVGGTGSGKSNLILKMAHSIFSPENQANHPCSVIILDPHGDLGMDMARSFPDLTKLVVLDPFYVQFGLNPLALTPYRDEAARKRQITTRVGELKTYLADVMRSDPERASRLSWIFTGDLHYLYSKGDNPTFKDFYFLVGDQSWMNKNDIRAMLIGSGLDDKTIEKTLEGILTLRGGEAFPPLLNRLARFVLPSGSLPARTFCTRANTVNVSEWLEPGKMTVIRIPKVHDIPDEFRELLAATVVLNVFFAVQSRASRLEEEGKDMSSRTPVFLFIDEFQTVERLQTLETILSEARKFGLSLVLANQYTAQLSNEALLQAIIQNAGVIAVGSVSGDDEKLFGRVLGEGFEDELDKNTTGTFAIRIRPYQIGGLARTERWPTSKFPAYARTQDVVIDYMKTVMETKYGGAEEHKDLIYKKDQMRVLEEAGRPKLSPLRWTLVWWLYKNAGNDFERTDAQLRKHFWDSYGWNSVQVHNALSDLMEYGYAVERTDYMDSILKGKDPQTGQPIYGAPTTQDEKERARVVMYALTKQAIEEFFSIRIHGPRAGTALHLLAIQKQLENYRDRLGYWCQVDVGEKKAKKPDIAVFKRETGGKTKDAREGSPDVWDDNHVIAIEVETNPRKHDKQVVENYEKNVGNYSELKFIVTLPEHVDDVHNVLADRDPATYKTEYQDVGLGRDRVAELENTPIEEGEGKKKEGEAEKLVSQALEAKPAGPPAFTQKDVWVFQYWKEHGKPVMGEPYRQKLLADPNWKDDPIWAAAEGKALLKTYHEREGMEVYKEREGREEAASPHKTQTSQPTPPLPLIQSTSLGAIPTSTAGFVHGTAVQAEPSGQQPEAVSQPSPQPAAETAAETTSSLSPDGLLTGSTTPSVGDRTGPETPGLETPGSAILGHVSSSVVMVPGEEGPSGDGAEEADNEGEEEEEGREVRRQKTASPTPAFKKRMVLVLNVIHERDLHANSEVAAAIGSSRRQTLRYLNELVDGGFLSEDKKQYFVTEKGQKVFQ